MGIAIDTLTPQQEKYLTSWEMGREEEAKGIRRKG